MTTNKYEVEFDKLLAKKNPAYYDHLKSTLDRFQESLVLNNVIDEINYQSFVNLLERIHKDENWKLKTDNHINEELHGLGKDLIGLFHTIEHSVIAQKYLNIDHSKTILITQQVSKMAENGQQYNRSNTAELLLKVYDERDFELPMVKLKIFRFLNPHPDDVIYIAVGKPTSN